MPYLELGWRSAALIACGLALLGASRRRFAPFAREAAVVLGLFALWQFAGSIAVMQTDGAMARGRWLWHAERVLHLPSESAVQRLFLPHQFVVRGFASYYNVAHLSGMVMFLAWLFVRHRDRYARVRTTLVGFTGLAFVVQLIPLRRRGSSASAWSTPHSRTANRSTARACRRTSSRRCRPCMSAGRC